MTSEWTKWSFFYFFLALVPMIYVETVSRRTYCSGAGCSCPPIWSRN